MQKGILLLIIFILNTLVSAQQVKIKFATLAPDGSTWMNVMKDFSEDLLKATDGQVKFKIYPGGVQGDERDVIRKIRINQLHSAGFTGVGLGEILPEVRILDAPFLFRNHDEVDYISNKFFDRFAQKFEQKGYVLLGWAEVGFVYIYSNKPARTVPDFKGVKMWMWEGDPLAEATFRAYDISPIPLSITDVMTSLQTGLIDGVYTAPLACVALQWFTKLNYALDVPLANSNGAVLISKRMFAKLSATQQQILKEKAKTYFDKLTQMSRQDNKTSTQKMIENGMQLSQVNDPAQIEEFYEVGRQARRALVGKLYDADLLDSVESALAEFRTKGK